MDAKCIARLERFCTLATRPFSPEMKKIWQNQIPHIAFRNPYLMHTMLSVATAHERYQDMPANSKRTRVERLHSHQCAVLFNRKLSRPIDLSQRDALWATAALLGMVAIASFDAATAEDAWPLRPSNPSDMEWFRLNEGKKVVWNLADPLRPGSIFRAMAREYSQMHIELPPTGAEGVPAALAEICGLGALSDSENNSYFVAAHLLARLESHSHSESRNLRVLSFVSQSQPPFRDLLQNKDAVALLLLALWYMRAAGVLWWIEERARVEYRAIRLFLERFHGDDARVPRLLQLMPEYMCKVTTGPVPGSLSQGYYWISDAFIRLSASINEPGTFKAALSPRRPRDRMNKVIQAMPRVGLSLFLRPIRPSVVSLSAISQSPSKAPPRFSSTMTTKAVVFVEKGKATIQEVPIPKLRDDYVLVKVNAVGINPTDWKHIDFDVAGAGSRIGCDYAGVVEAVGSKVTKPFSKGDRISGVVHGGDRTQHENGAFANYIVAKGDVQIKTPDNVSDEEAATLGISIATVGQGLYRTLGLPLPTEATKDNQYILIYGGSTATGIFGIQFAKLSGLRVVATASPQNFDYLKGLGAEAVFDYKSPTVADDIRKYTDNALQLAWDCTGFGGAIVAGSLSSEGGRYASIMPVNRDEVVAVNPNVDGPHVTLMYSIFGERFVKGQETPAKPEEFEFAKSFWEVARQLLEEGKLSVPRTIVNKGGDGFEGILKGLDELRANKVSGGKLVYTL
ncbi:hypothetical protein ACJZ2D_000945 [Fusarium nematophilum]